MLTIQEQIYGVSIIWSEAKYNFAFWNTRKHINWDKEYQETLSKVNEPMSIIEYYLELMRFISLLNDGHTYVDFPRDVSKDFLTLPIKIRNYSGRHIITNIAEGSDIPVYSEVLKINGFDFNAYMQEKILPYCWNIKPSSTYEMLYNFYWFDDSADKNAYALIPIIEKNKPMELLTSNGIYTITPTQRNVRWSLPHKVICNEKLTELFHSEGLIVEETNDKIAVITLPTFMDDKMPENFYGYLDKLREYKGFIIDVRNNGGGHSNNADAFSQAFIKGEFQTGKVKHPIHIGAYKAWGIGADFTNWDMKNPRLKKVYDVCNHNLYEEQIMKAYYPECPLTLEQPVVILENSATGSSAENLLINFDSIGRATIVGTPSYGTTGNPLFIELPGGGLARICTRKYTYPNDKEFINIGIKPHISAELTLDNLSKGQDTVMNRGLEVLRSLIL